MPCWIQRGSRLQKMKTLTNILLMGLAIGLLVMLTAEAQCTNGVKEPADCGDNEEYSMCMNNCPLTCANRDDPPNCIQVCLEEGCQCKNGYLRDSNGACVVESDCS
ncbi:cysteine-rich venom protein 6-like [Xenopus tropicalis]|uniref:Cysteine-rich venom protein 6-like n=1 Tax=Xenopus tropicalis TaxID=8364 RepID=A0A8J1JXC0_XENTR|nr:cysteine-rich venom protein 6-like [Xenopus tropicalis]